MQLGEALCCSLGLHSLASGSFGCSHRHWHFSAVLRNCPRSSSDATGIASQAGKMATCSVLSRNTEAGCWERLRKLFQFLARPGWVVVLWCPVLKSITKRTPLCNRMPSSSPVSPQDCCGKTFLFRGYHGFGAVWFLGVFWVIMCHRNGAGLANAGVVRASRRLWCLPLTSPWFCARPFRGPLHKPLTLCTSLPWPGLWSGAVSLFCNGEIAVIWQARCPSVSADKISGTPGMN